VIASSAALFLKCAILEMLEGVSHAPLELS
jgi:hypothetical protein